VLFLLIRQKFIYFAKSFIAPAIHLFINPYPQATVHHLCIIYLELNLLDKIHKEASETLTHSVLLFLYTFIPACFHCIDCNQHRFNHSLRLWCRPNQSGNIWEGARIPLNWALRMLDAIVLLSVKFTICRSIVIAVGWII